MLGARRARPWSRPRARPALGLRGPRCPHHPWRWSPPRRPEPRCPGGGGGQQARTGGLTPAHHQLLLAIRGHGDPDGPPIGEVADYLLLRHHSVVGLVHRAEAAGLVRPTRSENDHRVVRLHLTEDGAARLEALSALHLEELDRLALDVPGTWPGVGPVQRPHGFPGPSPEAATADDGRFDVGIAVDARPQRLCGRGDPEMTTVIATVSGEAPSPTIPPWKTLFLCRLEVEIGRDGRGRVTPTASPGSG